MDSITCRPSSISRCSSCQGFARRFRGVGWHPQTCHESQKWLLEQEPLHPPKSPIGNAIRYTLKQWEALTEFLDDPRLPLDNNPAEGALRVAALGRKNYLFVGNEQAGENLAGLYSLVATCEANGVNPEEYLADVLIRVKTHPNSRIHELLPPQWKRLRAEEDSRDPLPA